VLVPGGSFTNCQPTALKLRFDRAADLRVAGGGSGSLRAVFPLHQQAGGIFSGESGKPCAKREGCEDKQGQQTGCWFHRIQFG
jgi:hypothetical protein